MGIEPMTFFLPRKRSTTELHRRLWVGRDLNPRSPKAPNLQSGAIDRSATYPKKSKFKTQDYFNIKSFFIQ